MKAKELMEILSKANPNADVYFVGSDERSSECYIDITFAEIEIDNTGEYVNLKTTY